VLAIVAAVRTGRVLMVPSVKFLIPVLPEQEVLVSLGPAATGRMAFACTVGGQEVLRGALVQGAQP
jgi:hypothetical protein